MIFAPRPDVRCALVGRDLVLLDLADDAYLCLPEAADRPGPFHPDRLAPDARQVLVEAGLLTVAVEPSAPPPSAPPPPAPAAAARDLRHLAAARPTPGDLIAAALALGDLARLGRDPPVSRLLSLVRPSRGAAGDLDDIGRAAQAFSAILPWLPFEGACLRRSALLIAFLGRLDLEARWVFGVRTWPFRAHCWVQIDDLCLNDDSERLVAYTPILVA